MHFRLANSKKCCIFAVSKTNDTAMTYFEFANQFPDETSAINFIVSTKYKDGYVCPKCVCQNFASLQCSMALLQMTLLQ